MALPCFLQVRSYVTDRDLQILAAILCSQYVLAQHVRCVNLVSFANHSPTSQEPIGPSVGGQRQADC